MTELKDVSVEDAEKLEDLANPDPEISQDAANYFYDNGIPDEILARVEESFWSHPDRDTKSAIIHALREASINSIDVLERIYCECDDVDLVEEAYDVIREVFGGDDGSSWGFIPGGIQERILREEFLP